MDLYALEGSHRLAAAHHLGLIPKFVVEIPDIMVGSRIVTHTFIRRTIDFEAGDNYWTKVAETLPEYRFDKSLLLDLNNFCAP